MIGNVGRTGLLFGIMEGVVARSSNGRTPGSGPVCEGSSPSRAAKIFLVSYFCFQA